MSIGPVDNSGIDWKVGDIVDSVGGFYKNGIVEAVEKEGENTLLRIRWRENRGQPADIVQSRADSIVVKR